MERVSCQRSLYINGSLLQQKCSYSVGLWRTWPESIDALAFIVFVKERACYNASEASTSFLPDIA